MTNYHFKFRPYQRRFRQPLKTSHGEWKVREGIIINLTDETGRIGWGEIAPIPWFGSETLEEALNFCQKLPSEITPTDIFSIPARLPACQFGFESACWGMESRKDSSYLTPPAPFPLKGRGENCSPFLTGEGLKENCPPLLAGEGLGERLNQDYWAKSVKSEMQNLNSQISYSYLLPPGEKALQSWQKAWDEGYRTFKWKIGVGSVAEEITIFKQLVDMLPTSAKLRLDANGGLNQQECDRWLKICDNAGIVEFLEQPLPPQEFFTLLTMCQDYDTPIALDESVATIQQLEDCYEKGWRGIFVIKVAIAGSPKRLIKFCQDYHIDTVFSSVFETAIGRQMALHLASKLSHRPVGFGVNHWFSDDDDGIDFR
ncbi:MAG TPA: o-succinylbenzoate synthase [Cyanobacteria bacterium UBA11149]|nr:o-succinylbenzoate synthase [Cyanobacteria bacterium UBA11366]HBK66890.1 o-succinylbenzoate synthase [Cyanobacteria bacterium UBA11166]HBR73463.1 o-succinylbenzoate synthase [Cyanobacteria bacterium UBA11159]HBS71887.1 o-succinylbenzoate synthase [Cyanobacteria bacterium UBA11153]HBW88383.1 o-succinylbenzoate synthase [Cyanobacteria bacterium UBA11149]